MLVLRLALLPRINQALNEFKELYNNHQLRTESIWTPKWMWLNGVVNPSNPFAENLLENDIDNGEVYGMDPEGHHHSRTVRTMLLLLILNRDIKISWQFLNERFDLLAPSTEMGIDISIRVKEHIFELLPGEWIQARVKRIFKRIKIITRILNNYNV